MNNAVTVKDVSILWKEDKKKYVKASSYATYMNHVNLHILPVFGNCTAISEAEVQKFILNKLEEGVSLNTVHDIVVVLKMLMNYGVVNGFWQPYKWKLRYPTARSRKEVPVLSRDEHRRILGLVKSHLDERSLGIYISLSTGLRIGELCALQWSDIDMDRKVIHVSKTLERVYMGKGNSEHTRLIIGCPKTSNSIREIPISMELEAVLRDVMDGKAPDAYVLTNCRHPVEPRTYRYYFKRFLSDAGVPQFKFHALRHSFATRCIESGCDYKTVSVLLGHSNINTTLNLYVHPNYDQKVQCIERVFNYLLGTKA